jgi:hypothetical protein
MKRPILLLILLVLAALAPAADRTFDREGNVYLVVPGTLDGAPVLQMQILFASGLKTFMTVPGSEGPESEGAPQLYLSGNARTLYVAYERRGADGGDIVLAAYAIGGAFGDPVIVSEPRSGAFCVNPRLQQTHEIRVDEAGNKTILQFLHLLWWETGDRPGAMYCNIPLVMGTLDLASRTIIRLSDITDPYGIPGDLSGISPRLYEAPAFHVPSADSNRLYVLFADLGSLQYRLLELRYSLDGETVQDRAHFPDIGVKNSISLPTTLAPTGPVSSVIGVDGRIGLYSMGAQGPMVALFCEQWSIPLWLPPDFSAQEVGALLRSFVEDLP